MSRSRTLTILTLVLVVLVVGVGVGYLAHRPATATLRVTGSGTATAAPDTATFTVDVVTTGASNAAALATNDARTRAVTAAARADGLPASGLATTNLSLQPLTDARGRVTGYQADNQLTITTHEVARLGRLLGDVATAAGNAAQLSGVSFSLSSSSAALARARANAVAAAHRAGEEIARAAGRSLRGVVSLVDQENTAPVLWPSPVVFNASAARAGAVVPVSPGTQTLSVSVEVVYSLA